MSALLVLALGLAAMALAWRYLGFPGQSPADYAAQTPVFDPRRHLSGPILCEGMIFGPFGKVSTRFVARMEGHWQDNRAVIGERFHYDSGRVQDREWRLTLGPDGILAEADDLVGPGQGRMSGNTLQMRYRIRLAPEAGGHVLDVIDWMYLLDNGTILNRSQFRKYGVKVAELIATMRPA